MEWQLNSEEREQQKKERAEEEFYEDQACNVEDCTGRADYKMGACGHLWMCKEHYEYVCLHDSEFYCPLRDDGSVWDEDEPDNLCLEPVDGGAPLTLEDRSQY